MYIAWYILKNFKYHQIELHAWNFYFAHWQTKIEIRCHYAHEHTVIRYKSYYAIGVHHHKAVSSIQPYMYVIKVCLWLVQWKAGGLLRLLQFAPPIKLATMI